MNNRKRLYIVYFFSFFVLLFLTLNKHSRSELFHYRSEIYSDKAGYYVYLPYLINYKGDTKKMPKNIEKGVGGFLVDTTNNTVETKYTMGVAIMQLPFYLLTNAVAPVFNQGRTGFSEIYYNMINLAGIFYLLMGMILFAKLLQKLLDIDELLGFGFSWVILLGTNLFWYGIDETGMSHVYSFFLFNAYLVLFVNFWKQEKPSFKILLLISLVAGLIILVRPVNLLFLPVALFLDTNKLADLKPRFSKLFLSKHLIWFVGIPFLLFIPQFIYWKYTDGSFFHYSYGDEAFNWLTPKLNILLFAPGTGLFPFNPIYLIFVFLTLVLAIKTRKVFYWFILFFFIVISYIFSCWHDPGYGCSFGSRVFIEYAPLLSIPMFCILKQSFSEKKKAVLFTISFLLVCCIILNLKISYTYDGCFYGETVWDWGAFLKLLS